MNNTRRAETLFYLGFIPLMVVFFWRTTDFSQIERLETLTMLLFTGCVALKMLLFDTWKLWEVILFVICFAAAGLSYYKSTFMRPLLIVIAVYGAKGLDGRKILKVWLVLSIINIILTLSAAGLGLIENFQTEWTKGWLAGKKKNSLGFIYSTDCAARFFFTGLVYLYLRGNRLRWFEYIIFFAIAFILYRLTGGRIDSGCIVIASGLFVIVNFGKCILQYRDSTRGSTVSSIHIRNSAKKVLAVTALLSVPLGAVITIVLSYIYKPSGILLKLNKWMSTRLEIGHRTLSNYDITLFGTFIKMYGNGGGEAFQYIEDAKYNFIDISYLNVLTLYGLIFFVMIVGLFIYLSWCRCQDSYLMICIIMIAVNCMIAHHLTELAYVPFTVLVFAETNFSSAVSAEEFTFKHQWRNYFGLAGNQRLPDQSRR